MAGVLLLRLNKSLLIGILLLILFDIVVGQSFRQFTRVSVLIIAFNRFLPYMDGCICTKFVTKSSQLGFRKIFRTACCNIRFCIIIFSIYFLSWNFKFYQMVFNELKNWNPTIMIINVESPKSRQKSCFLYCLKFNYHFSRLSCCRIHDNGCQRHYEVKCYGRFQDNKISEGSEAA